MKTAEILLDALEYIKEFKGNVFVVKLGGEVLDDEEVVRSVARDLIFLEFVGIKSVVVHGGGRRISEAMKEAGKKPVFVGGLRVTDEETIRIVEKVLSEVNQGIVSTIKDLGGKAYTVSGKTGRLFETVKQKSQADLGFVGDIRKVNAQAILSHFNGGVIPIVSPTGEGADKKTYNINADTAAAALAKALKAEKIILLTNVQGVLDEKEKLISRLTLKEAEKLAHSKTVSGGMLPKLRACVNALESGVHSAHIIKASKHALLEEILTREGTGTMITRE